MFSLFGGLSPSLPSSLPPLLPPLIPSLPLSPTPPLSHDFFLLLLVICVCCKRYLTTKSVWIGTNKCLI